jgi:hypothetical protein
MMVKVKNRIVKNKQIHESVLQESRLPRLSFPGLSGTEAAVIASWRRGCWEKLQIRRSVDILGLQFQTLGDVSEAIRGSDSLGDSTQNYISFLLCWSQQSTGEKSLAATHGRTFFLPRSGRRAWHLWAMWRPGLGRRLGKVL